MRQFARFAILAMLAAGLLYVLVSRAGISWLDFATSIKKITGWALLSFAALTGVNLAFSALKWIAVLRAFAPGQDVRPSLAEAMLTTALGELVGQTMPVQAGITLVRSFASRLGVGWSFRSNLGTTIFEQLFDLIVVGIAAVGGLLGLALHVGPMGWGILTLVSILAALALSIGLPALLTRQALRLARMLDKPELDGQFQPADKAAAIPAQVLVRLAGLSIIRYISNMMRIVVVLGAFGMWNQATPALIGFPLVQLITALPITPGNLGVVEWTWSAVLTSAGATASGAALFALTARMANIFSLACLVAVLSGYLALTRAAFGVRMATK